MEGGDGGPGHARGVPGVEEADELAGEVYVTRSIGSSFPSWTRLETATGVLSPER